MRRTVRFDDGTVCEVNDGLEGVPEGFDAWARRPSRPARCGNCQRRTARPRASALVGWETGPWTELYFHCQDCDVITVYTEAAT